MKRKRKSHMNENNKNSRKESHQENLLEVLGTIPKLDQNKTSCNLPENEKIKIYESLIEKIIHEKELCVFSDMEEMEAFYQAMVCMKNRYLGKEANGKKIGFEQSITGNEADNYRDEVSRSVINNSYDGPGENLDQDSFEKENVGTELIHFQLYEGGETELEAITKNRNSNLGLLHKIVFMKVHLDQDLEVRIVFNRELDVTQCIHRSKMVEEKIHFFLTQFLRSKKIIITGSEEKFVEWAAKRLEYPYVLERDASGIFAICRL